MRILLLVALPFLVLTGAALILPVTLLMLLAIVLMLIVALLPGILRLGILTLAIRIVLTLFVAHHFLLAVCYPKLPEVSRWVALARHHCLILKG